MNKVTVDSAKNIPNYEVTPQENKAQKGLLKQASK
jgi:hypothetical protein